MSYETLIAIVWCADLAIWLLLVTYIAKNTRRISELYRQCVKPKYPVTGAEISKALDEVASPLRKLQIMWSVFVSRFAIIDARNTGDEELDSLISTGRKLFTLWLFCVALSALTLVYIETST